MMGGDRIPGPFNDAVDENSRRRRELNKRHGEDNAMMLGEALNRARASEIGRLNDIALGIHGERCVFIRKYTDAWLNADTYNKLLMRPVFEALIRKYGLKADSEEPSRDP